LADGLRADILRLASGARAEKAAKAADAAGVLPLADGAAAETAATPGAARPPVSAVIGHRVDEFLAPELDPSLAPPESVVHLPFGRVIASTFLGGAVIWILALIAVIVVAITTSQVWLLFTFVPAAIGLVSYVWNRITK